MDLWWLVLDWNFCLVLGFGPSVGDTAQGGARLAGRAGPEGGGGCLDDVETAESGRDTGVAAGNGGTGRRCGRGGGGGGPILGGFAAWGVSGVVEAPLLEPTEAESAPEERLASFAFWARRARFASLALLSSSPRRSASSTAVGGRG